jgi:SAM-dependent methyltransferase
MNHYKQQHKLVDRKCPVCDNNQTKKLGIRGNREYNGCDKTIEPHVVTNVVSCKICNHIYTNPEIRGLEYLEDEHYSAVENYLNVDQVVLQNMFKTRLSYIQKYITKDNPTLLDIGAGKGEFVNVAAKNNFLAEGIEPSLNFCNYATSTYNVKMYNGFLGSVGEIEGKKYDVITMHHVLEHVEEPVELLNSIRKYLNEDGLLFIEVPNCNSYITIFADLTYKLKGLNWSSRVSPLHAPFHKFGYTPKSLQYLLLKCGYIPQPHKTFAGKDRFSFSKAGIKYRILSFVSSIVNLFGNKELLCFVATPKK